LADRVAIIKVAIYKSRSKAMQAAAIVLGLAALGGLTLAIIRLRGTPLPPTWMALGHGAIAATGLGLLIYAAIVRGIPSMAQIALGVIVLAALGGATIFLGFHIRQRPLPIPLVIGHGLIAATGYVLLLAAIFR
jgi:ABC-type amino acid transport system permease subunit